MAVAPDGTYIVVWVENGVIKGKVYSFDGEVLRDAFEISRASGLHNNPSVVALSDGSFALAWERASNSGVKQIWGATLLPGGETDQFYTDYQIGGSTNLDQSNPEIVQLGSGAYLAVWDAIRSGSDRDIRYKVYLPNGTEIITEQSLSTTAGAIDTIPKVYAYPGGGATVAWVSGIQTDGVFTYTLKYRNFNSAGNLQTAEQVVNVGSFASPPKNFAIEALNSNGTNLFLVTWTENNGTTDLLRGKIFLGGINGVTVRNEFFINTSNSNYEQTPVIKGLANGGFVVVWVAASIKDGFIPSP